MHAFIQRLMQSTYSPSHIDETENYIKLFLSSLHEWDCQSKDKATKPLWLLSYSLLNLLHFLNMMRMYGPIRNLWEGSSMEKGILKTIKPNISSVNLQWHVVSTKKYISTKIDFTFG